MAEKFSIYFGEPLALAIAGYEDGRSARVNQIAADWLALVDALCPAFDEDQWLALADATLSSLLDDETTVKYLWADVDDTPGLGEKWGIDQAGLVARVRGLSWPELIALREVLRRYRALMGAHAPAQALRQAGARLAG